MLDSMSKMVQVRNMPEHIHRKLKERAARAGMSLSDYILMELRKSAEVPTLEEMKARLAKLPPVKTGTSTVHIIREERNNRDREIERRIRGRR